MFIDLFVITLGYVLSIFIIIHTFLLLQRCEDFTSIFVIVAYISFFHYI